MTYIAIGKGYYIFIFSASMAVFMTGSLCWKLFVQKNEVPGIGKVILIGLITGTISHYLTFILLSIYLNMCYLLTGKCTGSLGDPPASVIDMVTAAFSYTAISLMFFGWITAPASILIGLTIRKKKSETQSIF